MNASTHAASMPVQGPRSRRRRRWLALMLCAAIGAPLGAWRLMRSQQRPIDPALVVTARRQNLDVEVADVGRIEAAHVVQIRSQLPGRVARVLVREGDRVEPGQVLVELEHRDVLSEVERARAELEQARVRRDYAKKDAERKASGVEHGIVAPVDLWRARHDARLASLDVTLAGVALAEAQNRLENADLLSPIRGTVTRRAIEPGETIETGQASSPESDALLTIEDLSKLLVKIDLNQIDVAKVKLGQHVSVKLDALPGETFSAHVTKIAVASVRPTGKDVDVFPVEARLDRTDERVKPGMTGDTRIFVRQEQNVLALPLESVRRQNGKDFVTRVVTDARGEHIEQVRVTVGPETDRLVQIVSGIHAGARVLIDPPSASNNETKI